MANRNYHEQVKINNDIKLRELARDLPGFAMQYFRGIEHTTSSRTRIAYAYDLRTFFHYLNGNDERYKNIKITDLEVTILDALKPLDIELYLQYLKYYKSEDDIERSNNERGLMRKLASLKSFYNYFFRMEIIKTNPAEIVKMPKLHDKEIVRLDSDEVSALLDEVESGSKLTKSQKAFHEKTKVRDSAILTLLLGTGIRVSECVGIDINDVDFKNHGIKIRRKGGNEVVVYFGDEVETALLDYLDERKKTITEPGHEDAFFLSMQKKRIGVRSVELLVKKYSMLITKLKKITPHKLRSTYGTSLYKETGDIYLVADILGHKDVNTTKKNYAAIEDDRRRGARNKVNLRDH